MEYITVREAAQRWKISVRLTQQYCIDGRIQGAVKFGGAWAIPADARKPTDPRRARREVRTVQPCLQPVPETEAACLTPMPLLNGTFRPGHCQEFVEGIEDPRLRDIARAEYAYFSGRAEEAVRLAELYLSHRDLALRLSACLIYAYANLTLGQIHRPWRRSGTC